MEWSFFIREDALKRVQPDMRPDEAGFLRAFDVNRGLIQAAATKAYKRERKASYELPAMTLSLQAGWPAENELFSSFRRKSSRCPALMIT
jgi:Protein of unknown function (DUF1488)